MKIVGKHKDYYDNGAQFGFDENITFVRDINYIEDFLKNHTNDNWRKETKPQLNHKMILPYNNIIPSETKKKKFINYNPFYVWFAGSVVLGYEIKDYSLNNLPIPSYDIKRYYVYGDEMLSKIKYLEDKKLNRYKKNTDVISDIKNQMKNIKIINGFDIAKEFNTSYFVVFKGIIIPTPSLKDIQFFKVKDYIQAWQQIESFLPSLKEEPISEMTNDEKIYSHGMDATSFRCQAPGNKKEKRRKNKLKKRNKNKLKI